MLVVFIIIYILAHITPPVALAVSIMGWASIHWILVLLFILLLA